MNPFTALKNLSPFQFTLLFFSLILSPLHFILLCYPYPQLTSLHFLLFIALTSLYFAIHVQNSLPFTSLSFSFTFYRLHFRSLVFTFLTLVLKICVLPLEVPIAPSGSLFQSVMDLFTKEYFPISVLCFLVLIFQ